MATIAFYILAAITLAGAFGVVLAANPFTCAVSLIVSLLGVAALFAYAGSGFLAVIQVLIYAGAIVTLFIFVVMLLNLKAEELTESGWNFQKLTGGVAAALVAVNIAALSNIPVTGGAAGPVDQEVLTFQLAEMVFERYGLAFELVSILLLVALVGVIALAKREKAS